MKKILVGLTMAVVVMLGIHTTALAQAGFAYQAVIRNADGSLLRNASVAIKFSLSSDGNACYVEEQKTTTDNFGSVSVVVGEGTAKTGSMAGVPWNSLNVMMKVEIDVKGDGRYVPFAEMQIQPVPYALYAASTSPITEIVAAAGSDPNAPLFSVKDKDGNLVFAVYRDGVQVIVDDSASTGKSMKSGFAVSKRHSATKDGESDDLLVIDAEGTHIYVDADESKAMRSSFAVSNRHSATKDGETTVYEDVLTVNNAGTQVFVDDEAGKAMRSSFAVSGRHSATKDGEEEKLFAVNNAGTQVYIDNDGSKAMRSSFAVSNRHSATKDGDSIQYEDILTVNNAGTQVYVDDEAGKAMRSSFAVSNRHSATKEESSEMLLVNADGTQVFVDSDENKAMRSSFAVSKRHSATKDGEVESVFTIDADGTNVYIDDVDDKAMRSSFAVSGRHSASKDSNDTDYMHVSSTSTTFGINDSQKSEFAIVNINTNEQMLSVAPQNVDFLAPLQVSGGIQYKYAYDTLPDTLCLSYNCKKEHDYYGDYDISALINYYYRDLLGGNGNYHVGMFSDKGSVDSLNIGTKSTFKMERNSPVLRTKYETGVDTVIDDIYMAVYIPYCYEMRLMPLKITVGKAASVTVGEAKSGSMSYRYESLGFNVDFTRHFWLDDDASYLIYEYDVTDVLGNKSSHVCFQVKGSAYVYDVVEGTLNQAADYGTGMEVYRTLNGVIFGASGVPDVIMDGGCYCLGTVQVDDSSIPVYVGSGIDYDPGAIWKYANGYLYEVWSNTNNNYDLKCTGQKVDQPLFEVGANTNESDLIKNYVNCKNLKLGSE